MQGPDVEPMGNKFIRRTDLTPAIRLHIATTALVAKNFGIWGATTALSRQYMISRTFVYVLAAQLEQTSRITFDARQAVPATWEDPYSWMLSLRLEGRCSIEAVSAIMKRFGIDKSSVGCISQQLHRFGALVPDTLSTEGAEVQLAIFFKRRDFRQNRSHSGDRGAHQLRHPQDRMGRFPQCRAMESALEKPRREWLPCRVPGQ
jgi:hypothetical protein